MKILAVETATAMQSVALLDGTAVIASSSEDAQGAHTKRLIPMIDRLLQASGWSLSSLNGLAVSVGPGSFTGLRVGLATMLGFRSVTGLPLAAVPTLEALCWNMRPSELPLCPIIRSRPGEVYWGVYRWTDADQLDCLVAEQVGSVERLVAQFDGPTIVLGEGWQVNREEARRFLGERAGYVREAPSEQMQTSAVSIGLAGGNLLRQGKVAGSIVAPRYVQRAEAEIVWERRHMADTSVATKSGG